MASVEACARRDFSLSSWAECAEFSILYGRSAREDCSWRCYGRRNRRIATALHGFAAKEAQTSSLPLRAKMCRLAYAGGDQVTFLPPNGIVGSSTAARLISL